MISKRKYTGFAIAIAWPETWCKQSGAWWDGFLNRIGLSKNHYFKVGHAALVLVDSKTGKCFYFDFGRYHTPFNHGRVRSEKTDDGLKMITKARISVDRQKIVNFEEILNELQMNPECHGEGSIHASYGKIDFNSAFSKASLMQQKSPIRYGPFRYGGSNCSRFVNTAIRAGNPAWFSALKLNFFVPLTPTTLNNVNSFGNKVVLPKQLPFPAFVPQPIDDKSALQKTLPAPERAKIIPSNAQWLSGEGAGSWFNIIANDAHFIISRYGPDGNLECESEFLICNKTFFDISKPYRFDYLSHCRKVIINQNGENIEFFRMRRKINCSETKNSSKQLVSDSGKTTKDSLAAVNI
jgi:hypothetical protein